MKETYEMSPDGELVITVEAETREEEVELKEVALQLVRDGLRDGEDLELWAGDEASMEADRG